MIGKPILHYKILERLGEGGMGVLYTPLDKSDTPSVSFYNSMLAKLFWRINQVCYPTGYKAEDTKLKRTVAIKFPPRQIAASGEDPNGRGRNRSAGPDFLLKLQNEGRDAEPFDGR